MVASTFKRSFVGQTALTLVMLTACASAFAVSTWDNFNLSSNCTPDTNAGTSLATCTPPSVSAGTLTLQGLSTAPLVNNQDTANFSQAQIYDWGPTNGLGVVAGVENSATTGPHAIDNKYGTDAILFNFSAATSLNGVKLGWNGTDNSASGYYNDSDVSIFAWTGGPSAPAQPNPTGVSPATLMAANSGWTLVGNFFNVGSLQNNTVATGSGVYSSYWLISAYNTNYGARDAADVTTSYDAFKVLEISANKSKSPEVPEPGSLALIGAAVMGLAVSRRRKLVS